MRSRQLVVSGVLVLGVAFFLSIEAWAQAELNPQSPRYRLSSEGWWHVDAFGGIESEPDYPGSDDNEFELLYDVRLLLKDPWNNRYTLSIGRLTATFDLLSQTSLHIALEYEEGREASNAALDGFEDGKDTLEGEISLIQWIGNFYIFGTFQPDLLDRGKGIVWFIGAGYDTVFWNQRLRLSPLVDLSFANADHMQTEFGITREQAVASGLEEYRPGGGLKSMTGGLSMEYYLTPHWSVFAQAEVEYYFERAAESPLLKTFGSELTHEFNAGVHFRY